MIFAGNKVDLLPPDGETGYLKRFSSSLKKCLQNLGLFDAMNVLDVILISAKSGYGIEKLITTIQTKWENKGTVIRT